MDSRNAIYIGKRISVTPFLKREATSGRVHLLTIELVALRNVIAIFVLI